MSPLQDSIMQLNQVLGDFIQFLEEEAVALAAKDAEALGNLLPRRNEIHRALAGKWLDIARHAGVETPKGLLDMRKRLFADTPPPPAWQKLEELAHVSDRLNHINGRLIDEQMRRTQAAMQVLQNSLSSRGGLYGADGKVSGFMDMNRRIDSA